MRQKIKVFQNIKRCFDKNGNKIPPEERKIVTVCIGTVLTPKHKEPDEEIIWHLFNWACWYKDRKHGIKKGFNYSGYRCFPNNNARGYCNGDIFFEMNGQWFIALSFGWTYATSYENAVRISRQKQYLII